MRKRLIWPGMLIILIAAIVAVDVTMLIVSSRADIYTVIPTDNEQPRTRTHERASAQADEDLKPTP